MGYLTQKNVTLTVEQIMSFLFQRYALYVMFLVLRLSSLFYKTFLLFGIPRYTITTFAFLTYIGSKFKTRVADFQHFSTLARVREQFSVSRARARNARKHIRVYNGRKNELKLLNFAPFIIFPAFSSTIDDQSEIFGYTRFFKISIPKWRIIHMKMKNFNSYLI